LVITWTTFEFLFKLLYLGFTNWTDYTFLHPTNRKTNIQCPYASKSLDYKQWSMIIDTFNEQTNILVFINSIHITQFKINICNYNTKLYSKLYSNFIKHLILMYSILWYLLYSTIIFHKFRFIPSYCLYFINQTK